MPFKLIIFDFDGTLADTRDRIVSVIQQVVSKYGLPQVSNEECASTIGLPLADCFRKLYPFLDVEQGEMCAETYRQYFFAHSEELVPTLFPDVLILLSELYKRHILMGIASSRTSRSLNYFVERMDLSMFFKYIVGCEDVPLCKPAPDAVNFILRQCRVDPNETLVVGDMPVDIQMAHTAGCHSCAVTYGNSSKETLLSIHPDCIIDSPLQLLSYL